MQKRGYHAEMPFIRLMPCQQKPWCACSNASLCGRLYRHVPTSLFNCSPPSPPRKMFPFGIDLAVVDLFAMFFFSNNFFRTITFASNNTFVHCSFLIGLCYDIYLFQKQTDVQTADTKAVYSPL